MKIRLAEEKDISVIEAIYDSARTFMCNTGNMYQWSGGYPNRELILSDLNSSSLYVAEQNDRILGVFVYFYGTEPTYSEIHDGEWKNSLPYGVIHRIAVAENAHGMGVSRACFDFAFKKCGNLKIDTHRDNLPMQRSLVKNGFEYCGIIYLENKEERLAFQKCI